MYATLTPRADLFTSSFTDPACTERSKKKSSALRRKETEQGIKGVLKIYQLYILKFMLVTPNR